ncbi:hypothetical protein [Streptomyces katrae]|uniref:hypothetical protein n=1 Tax=Streptomyces katrae TaxID=68223 RepID=UPI0004C0D9C0|nr:hypothetical protein [Streptomyces katrae]
MSDLTAGIFALGGALVGGAATFAGTVWELHQQRRTARTEMAKAAVDQVMTEFSEIQKAIRLKTGSYEWPAEDTRHTWPSAFWRSETLTTQKKMKRFNLMQDRRQRIEIAILRVPDTRLRLRIQLDIGMIYTLPTETSASASHSRDTRICDDALDCLGAYQRGEPIPEPNHAVQAAFQSWKKYSGVTGLDRL